MKRCLIHMSQNWHNAVLFHSFFYLVHISYYLISIVKW